MARLGKYELIRQLSDRGITERYRAREGDVGRIVYRLRPELCKDIEIVRAFVGEARAVSRLEHPNLISVREVGKSADGYFFVGDDVRGISLAKVLDKAHHPDHPHPMYPSQAVMVVARVCAALHEVHMLSNMEGVPLGQIHGAVQPHNVLLTTDGHVLLRGLGLSAATTLSARGNRELAYDNVAAAFLSPEQVARDNVDPRSDIFSAGALLIELLAGRRVFMRESVQVTLKAISVAAIPALPNVDDALLNIVSRALARDRRERFVTAADMQIALEGVLERHPASAEDLARYLGGLFGDKLAAQEEGSVMVPLPTAPPAQVGDHAPPPPPVPDDEPASPVAEPSLGAPAPIAEPVSQAAVALSPVAPRSQGGSRKTVIAAAAAVGLALLALIVVLLLPDDKAKQPTLTIESEPAGGTVYINATKRHGATPMQVSDLAPGKRHHVVVMLDEHKVWKSYVTLKEGEQRQLVAELERKVTAGAAQLLVVAPEEAKVYLDSELRGTAPLRIRDVKPGVVHTLTVTKEGFNDKSLQLSPLQPDEKRRVTLTLDPAPKQPRRARPRKPVDRSITVHRAKGSSLGGRHGERLPPKPKKR